VEGYPNYKIAIAHVSPVFLDTPATIAKACSIIEEAARHGAQLVAFPETYVPAFPLWSALQAPIYSHDFFLRLARSALRGPGPELERVARTARAAQVFVSLGINEGTVASVGCIWNANVLIGDDGAILNHHRKLVPTFYEKLTWANGDGAGLRVCETRLGRIGMLICGENTNPLARYALMAQGEQVHIASYPPLWPTRDPRQGSANYDLAGAIRIRAGAHSFEAKCFTLVAAGYLDPASREILLACGPEAGRIMDESPRGASMVIDPTGKMVGSPLCETEGILYADIDLAACVEPKQFHDITGGYNRFDIFRLTVNRAANRPISFAEPTTMDSEAANMLAASSAGYWRDSAIPEEPPGG
jgi:nitrilase